MSSKSFRLPSDPLLLITAASSKHRTNLINIRRNVGVQAWDEVSSVSSHLRNLVT